MALLGLCHHITNRELKSLHMYYGVYNGGLFIYLFSVLGFDFERQNWFSSPKEIAMYYCLHLQVTF